ncbi:hypothetical protein [Rhizobium ruizarguesonis]|uniref:hypothetical protein n=1 Tax=Rhizobium TaxID=379 RepID=UPI001031155B|nr:hypothetical protein [Rhizobium ruizarguesonis]TBC98995.1 hypothetical protein ELH25_10085 [Rhizobium ruizarguesonis]TBE32875.1 hypothetical protein ELH07_09515 [Rhizobium ruizarguesonis]
MRSYAAIPPSIWQTEIKKLRGDVDAIAVHYHLTTSRHSNMIGLYMLPLVFLAHEIGSPVEGARKGLRSVIEAGICTYDEELEIVWVHDMAKSQVAPRLSPKDNRVVAVAKLLSGFPICPITLAFYAHYRELFHLGGQPTLDEFERGFRVRLKPLRNKEQEQDLGAGAGTFGSEGQMDTYPHARAADAEEPFDVPASHIEGRSFLVSKGLPPQFMEQALERLMKRALFPCDISDWINEARGVA